MHLKVSISMFIYKFIFIPCKRYQKCLYKLCSFIQKQTKQGPHIYLFFVKKQQQKNNISSLFSLYSHFPHSHTLFTKTLPPTPTKLKQNTPTKLKQKNKNFIYNTRISLSLHISHARTHFTIHHSLFSR